MNSIFGIRSCRARKCRLYEHQCNTAIALRLRLEINTVRSSRWVDLMCGHIDVHRWHNKWLMLSGWHEVPFRLIAGKSNFTSELNGHNWRRQFYSGAFRTLWPSEVNFAKTTSNVFLHLRQWWKCSLLVCVCVWVWQMSVGLRTATSIIKWCEAKFPSSSQPE